MTNVKLDKIYGVIVTYKPEKASFERTLDSLRNQLGRIYVIDNSSPKAEFLNYLDFPHVDVICLSKNKGIAYAQNIGIKRAIKEKAAYVLLSDQDTVYPENYIAEMLKCFNDEKVAAAGSLFVDTHTGEKQFFIMADKLGFKKIYPSSGKHEVLQLIASGTIIKLSALKDIGLMREDFFIDWVDMEWCWRAIKKGYKIIGNADVVVYHQHGNDSKKLFGKDITIKTPIRYYYTIRNGIYLALHTDLLNLFLRYLLFIKTFRNAFIYPLLIKPHFKSLKYSLLGLYHGIKGKLGNLNEPH